jgi:hypothetical protein
MGNPKGQDQALGISDRVDDAVVADAHSPQVGIVDERLGSAGPRVVLQRVEGPHDALSRALVELCQLLERLFVSSLSASGVILNVGGLRGATHNPSVRVTSSAGTALVRSATRSASRSSAIRASSKVDHFFVALD